MTTIETITKPMLAGKAPANLDDIIYPVLASPKLDGIRCLMLGGKALTRKFLPIPNDHVRTWCEANLPDGFDGELLLRDWTAKFKEVSSAIMSKAGEPDFTYAAFDWVRAETGLTMEFRHRYASLDLEVGRLTQEDISCRHHLFRVRHWQVEDANELRALYAEWLAQGFEGAMVRSRDGHYKCGRSTIKQALLLKIKNFVDEEAVVIGVEEQMHNTNDLEIDNVGHAKRSSAKAGMVGKRTMGKLVCRFEDGTEFKCGTGFTNEQRLEYWNHRHLPSMRPVDIANAWPVGCVIKIKHQPDPGGRQPGQAPRIPVFLGFRKD